MTTAEQIPRADATTCPLCHAAGPTLSDTELEAGADWRCLVCHQSWDATRLGTVAAYADFCAQRAASAALVPGLGGLQGATPSPAGGGRW